MEKEFDLLRSVPKEIAEKAENLRNGEADTLEWDNFIEEFR